jgi:predicted metal-dependent hydrolase
MDQDSQETGPILSQEEIGCACSGTLPVLVIKGLELFNAHEYFEAHESLETAWRQEPGPIRELYRGILQVSVAYYHLLRKNYAGARKVFQRCHKWLEPFPDICRGIDLAGFRQDYLRVEAEIIRLGPDHLGGFNPLLLKHIQYKSPAEKRS